LNITLYKKSSRTNAILLMAIPLLLSGFTHLWNPVGFPGIYYNEARLIERAVQFVEGLGSRDQSWLFDHPIFAEIFLAGSFAIIGYPQSLHLTGDVHSIEMLYLIPRVLMGILAIIDTFLIYKICENCYNRGVALIASIFFAVMPLSWLLRNVYFESIQLPLILSSILFATYGRQNAKSGGDNIPNRSKDKNPLWTAALSGVFLGLAILTHVSGLGMIPLVGFIIYRYYRGFKTLGFWLIPLILILMAWPIYALWTGELDRWMDTQGETLWQTSRLTQPLFDSVNSLLEIDPILVLVGTIGILYVVAVKRDPIPALWVFPSLVLVYILQNISFWQLIPLIPIYCIASALLVVDTSMRISNRQAFQKNLTEFYDNTDNLRKKLKQYGDFYLLYQYLNRYYYVVKVRLNKQSASRFALFFAAGISILGLTSVISLLQTNVNFAYFNTVAYLSRYLFEISDLQEDNSEENIAVIGSPRYTWIPRDVFDEEHLYRAYTSTTPIPVDKKLVVADKGFMNTLQESEFLQSIYNNTSELATFKGGDFDSSVYPYSSLKYASPYPEIEIRLNDPYSS
jgi:hypothetical protein